MGDKSPHDAHHASKKSGKAIKEKRAERRAKEQAAPSVAPLSMARLMADRKHRG